MKRYVKANTSKPVLDSVQTSWEEFDDESGIMFTIKSDDGETLFEEMFNYEDVDSDAIYDSAVEMAIIALSQQYELTDNAIDDIKGNEP